MLASDADGCDAPGMRKMVIVLASAMMAVSLASSPAQAETLRNVYYYDWDCHRVGHLGIASGWWTSYHCDLMYGKWFLYA